MGDSAAERQRRSRKHRAGDHSLCVPGRCAQVTPSRGRGLWEKLHAGLGPAQLVLLEEACRITDRLDRLDEHLDGKSWLTFRTGEDVTEVTVVVDRVLAEARQQAATLKQLLAELRQSSAKHSAPAVTESGKAGGGIADLTARIAARRDTAPG